MRVGQLLCSFSDDRHAEELISAIKKQYFLTDRRIFVFEDLHNKNSILLTYNIQVYNNSFSKFPNTISIHRKKTSNTLYTLNALNKIIEEENNGVLDKSYQINWDLYKDCLIITHETGYRIIDLGFLHIVRI